MGGGVMLVVKLSMNYVDVLLQVDRKRWVASTADLKRVPFEEVARPGILLWTFCADWRAIMESWGISRLKVGVEAAIKHRSVAKDEMGMVVRSLPA
jgi:hypothetical protein